MAFLLGSKWYFKVHLACQKINDLQEFMLAKVLPIKRAKRAATYTAKKLLKSNCCGIGSKSKVQQTYV